MFRNTRMFATLMGFIERFMDGDAYGRTHATTPEWDRAYDHGASLADSMFHDAIS